MLLMEWLSNELDCDRWKLTRITRPNETSIHGTPDPNRIYYFSRYQFTWDNNTARRTRRLLRAHHHHHCHHHHHHHLYRHQDHHRNQHHHRQNGSRCCWRCQSQDDAFPLPRSWLTASHNIAWLIGTMLSLSLSTREISRARPLVDIQVALYSDFTRLFSQYHVHLIVVSFLLCFALILVFAYVRDRLNYCDLMFVLLCATFFVRSGKASLFLTLYYCALILLVQLSLLFWYSFMAAVSYRLWFLVFYEIRLWIFEIS